MRGGGVVVRGGGVVMRGGGVGGKKKLLYKV